MKRNRSTRRRAQRRFGFRMFSGLLLLGLAALTVVGLPYLLRKYGDRLPLRVQELRVTGSRVLSGVDIQNLAGVNKGDPLFGSWIDQALTNLSENPWVASAAVVRSITGRVEIKVLERKPVALANLGDLYYVDASGNILERARSRSLASLDFPVISGPWKKDGTEIFSNRVSEAVSLLHALVSAGVKEKQISELHWDSNLGWVIFPTRCSARAVFGTTDFKKRAQRFSRVLEDFQGRMAILREIDLDFVDRAIVKLQS